MIFYLHSDVCVSVQHPSHGQANANYVIRRLEIDLESKFPLYLAFYCSQ